MDECNNGIEVIKTKYIKINSESIEEDEKPKEDETQEEKPENLEEVEIESSESLKNSSNSVIFRETTV